MPASVQVVTEIDSETMNAVAQALEPTGFTLPEILSLTVAKIARDKCVPFDADAALEEEYGNEIPNALTRETMAKVLRGEELHKAKDINDLFYQLDN